MCCTTSSLSSPKQLNLLLKLVEYNQMQPNQKHTKWRESRQKKNKLALPLVSKSEKFKVVYSFSALAINPFSKNKSLSGARRTPHVC